MSERQMAMIAYDTLKIARDLEGKFGFDQKQAEGIAITIHDHLVSNVATKEDLKRLEERIDAKFDARFNELDVKIDRIDAKFDARFNELDAKIDRIDAKFDAKFDNVVKTVIIAVGGMLIATVSVQKAIEYFFF